MGHGAAERDSQGRGRWVAALAAGMVLVLVRVEAATLVFDETAYLGATLGGAALAWWGSRGRIPAERRAWRWVAMGLAASAAGDLVWAWQVLQHGVAPDTSFGDVFWMASYVGLGAGLWHMVGPQDRSTRAMTLLDTGAVGVMALLVVWQVGIVPTWGDDSIPAAVRLVWSAYPVLDAVLLMLLARLFVAGARSASTVLLALGVAGWLASDFAFMWMATADSWTTLLDAGWMLGSVAMGSAALAAPVGGVRPAARAGEASTLQLVLGALPILVPAALDVLGHAGGGAPSPVPLLLATIPLAVLIFLRGLLFVRSNMRIRHELVRRQQHYRALAANSSDAAFVVTPAGDLVDGEASLVAFLRRVGLDAAATAALLSAPTTNVDPNDHAAWLRLLRQAGDSPGRAVSREMAVRLGEETRWLETRVSDLTDDPAVGGLVVNVHDVTDRRRAQDQLVHQTMHDSLTGLPNRVLLRDRVDQALARARREGRHVAVIHLDLDGFKRVNDGLGHDAGDQLLCEVARRLSTAIREEDTVARLGGDEFAILVEDSHDPLDDAAVVADRVLQALGDPVQVADRPVVVSASLGIALSDHAATSETLLRDADMAMYSAKSGGRGRWAVHQPDMQHGVTRRLRLEADLLGAVEGDQLRLQYQPVLDLAEDRVVGFEALLRWEHPEFGRIPPDEFIGLAEDNGLIVPIGRWVLQTACHALASWMADAAPDDAPLSVGVNLSARQLASDRIVDDVVTALAISGLPPWALTLEITETALVDDVPTAAARLGELRDLGVRLAIDDFGTGYSSLAYLRQFPVDVLKIDRTFIDGITDGEDVPALVTGMLELAATLGLTTVAEGVELAVQRDQLQAAGCDLAQGYLFARPTDPEHVPDLLAGDLPGLQARPTAG